MNFFFRLDGIVVFTAFIALLDQLTQQTP